MTTEVRCECDTPERTHYIVVSHDGTSAEVEYCDDCAALARDDWNGETAAIVEASARFLSADNPSRFAPSDVADIGLSVVVLRRLFSLAVGEGYTADMAEPVARVA